MNNPNDTKPKKVEMVLLPVFESVWLDKNGVLGTSRIIPASGSRKEV